MKTFFIIVCLLAASLLMFGCTQGTFAGKAIGGAANLCGNDQLDEGEECDSPPDNSGYFTKNCNTLGFDGGRIACTSECKLDTSGCNAPPAPVEKVVQKVGCGNSVLDEGEECDSPPDNSGFFTKVCNDLGFDGGRIACTSECKLNTGGCNPKSCSEGWICQSPDAKVYQYANCALGNQSIYCANGCLNGECKDLTPTCGNNLVEAGEECDGSNFAGKKCSDFPFGGSGKNYQTSNFVGRNLTCNSKLCTIDYTRCLKPTCQQIYGSGYICYHNVTSVPESVKGLAKEIGCDLAGKENWSPGTDLKLVQGDMCAPSWICGDGIITYDVEDCDDHNILNGDGCSSECKYEQPRPDLIIEDITVKVEKYNVTDNVVNVSAVIKNVGGTINPDLRIEAMLNVSMPKALKINELYSLRSFTFKKGNSATFYFSNIMGGSDDNSGCLVSNGYNKNNVPSGFSYICRQSHNLTITVDNFAKIIGEPIVQCMNPNVLGHQITEYKDNNAKTVYVDCVVK